MKPIEDMPDQPSKTFEVIKQLKEMRPRKELLIKTENGLTANEQRQTELITSYFQKHFF